MTEASIARVQAAMPLVIERLHDWARAESANSAVHNLVHT